MKASDVLTLFCATRARLLFLLILLMLSSLCFAKEDWTILVYMAADNGLSQYAYDDINQMEEAILPSGTQVVVQVDYASWFHPSGAYRYKIAHDSTATIASHLLQNMGEINSGDPHTLNSFIKWGQKKYPASHYAVVVWSHGDSWYKGIEYKWICPDNTSEQLMSPAQGDLKTAFDGTRHFDMLLFDVCSMQSLEILSQVQSYTDIVVGSEDLVPATGFPYNEILRNWQGEGYIIAQQLPALYVNSYLPYGSQNPEGAQIAVTCSALRTGLSYSYASSFIRSLARRFSTKADSMLTARLQCHDFNSYEAEVDAVELFTRIDSLVDTTKDPHAVPIATLILQYLNEMTISRQSYGYSHYVGTATIWFPKDENTINVFWQRYLGLGPDMAPWVSIPTAAWIPPETPPPITIKTAGFVDGGLNLTLLGDPSPHYQEVNAYFVPDDSSGTVPIYNYVLYPEVGVPFYIFPTQLRDELTILYPMPEKSGWLYSQSVNAWGQASAVDSLYVRFRRNMPDLIVFPNPVRKGEVLSCFSTKWMPYPLRIYDIKGQLVHVQPAPITPGKSGISNGFQIEIGGFHPDTAGVYILKAGDGKHVPTAKFTVLP